MDDEEKRKLRQQLSAEMYEQRDGWRQKMHDWGEGDEGRRARMIPDYEDRIVFTEDGPARFSDLPPGTVFQPVREETAWVINDEGKVEPRTGVAPREGSLPLKKRWTREDQDRVYPQVEWTHNEWERDEDNDIALDHRYDDDGNYLETVRRTRHGLAYVIVNGVRWETPAGEHLKTPDVVRDVWMNSLLELLAQEKGETLYGGEYDPEIPTGGIGALPPVEGFSLTDPPAHMRNLHTPLTELDRLTAQERARREEPTEAKESREFLGVDEKGDEVYEDIGEMDRDDFEQGKGSVLAELLAGEEVVAATDLREPKWLAKIRRKFKKKGINVEYRP